MTIIYYGVGVVCILAAIFFIAYAWTTRKYRKPLTIEEYRRFQERVEEIRRKNNEQLSN